MPAGVSISHRQSSLPSTVSRLRVIISGPYASAWPIIYSQPGSSFLPYCQRSESRDLGLWFLAGAKRDHCHNQSCSGDSFQENREFWDA